jgi:hypothetical protein
MSPNLPWNRPLTWAEVESAERKITLAAEPEDLARIAGNLPLEALASLVANLTLRPWLDGVEIDGQVHAIATQMCGVSLEPFEVVIDEPFRIRVVPTGSPNAPRGEDREVVIDLDADDPPDEATGPSIDLAAYAVETLALALDPFPRKPGAVFSQPDGVGSLSPFAALAGLAKRPSEN